MLRWINITGTGPAPELRWELADRLNLLTGDNGLGKSFLLDVAWRALTRTWAGRMALLREGAGEATIEYQMRSRAGEAVPVSLKFNVAEQTWKLPQARPPDPGLVIYARSDGGFAVWDPARHYWRNAPTIGVVDLERPGAYHFTEANVWEGLKVGDRQPCEGLIRDWVGWQRGQQPEFALLRQVLAVLATPEEPMEPAEPMRVSLDDGFDVPTVRTRYGRVPLTHSSAGMRRVVGLAYLLVWAWREHQVAAKLLRKEPERRLVLLFDEPETHLHPKWQRLLLPALLRAVDGLMGEPGQAPSVQVLVATHAPLVLASLEPLFDPERDALWELTLAARPAREPEVKLEKRPWRRLGDAASWLTSDVFDLKSARSIEAERALEEASLALSNPGFDREQALRLDARLRGLLGDTDPFWIRWRFVGEQRGWLR